MITEQDAYPSEPVGNDPGFGIAPIWFIAAALVIVVVISACADYAKKEKDRIRDHCADPMYNLRHWDMCREENADG